MMKIKEYLRLKSINLQSVILNVKCMSVCLKNQLMQKSSSTPLIYQLPKRLTLQFAKYAIRNTYSPGSQFKHQPANHALTIAFIVPIRISVLSVTLAMWC